MSGNFSIRFKLQHADITAAADGRHSLGRAEDEQITAKDFLLCDRNDFRQRMRAERPADLVHFRFIAQNGVRVKIIDPDAVDEHAAEQAQAQKQGGADIAERGDMNAQMVLFARRGQRQGIVP